MIHATEWQQHEGTGVSRTFVEAVQRDALKTALALVRQDEVVECRGFESSEKLETLIDGLTFTPPCDKLGK